MPLRRAHEARFGSVRSRLQARENREWMCRSATYASAATEDPALSEGTRCILSRPPVRFASPRSNQLTDLDVLWAAQVEDRDLRRRTDPDRGTPESGPVGHEDRHTVHRAETGHHGLLQPDHQVEGCHLAAVGVSGNLQINPERGGLVDR